jgi:hypothetical protein
LFASEADPEDTRAAPVGKVAWFPAWLAIQHRWIAHLFRPDEVPETSAPLRAFRLLPALLVLERQGYGAELVQRRRALRDLSPPLFRRYWQLVVETGRPANVRAGTRAITPPEDGPPRTSPPGNR